MKKSRLAILFLFFIPFIGLSQKDHNNKNSDKSAYEEVVICEDKNKLSFHSHAQCIGLETCNSDLQYILANDATKKYSREACCICWDNPGEDCKNDNPNYYDEEITYDDPEFFVDDLWWLDGGQPYFFIIAVASSVALVSNEVSFGISYPFLPPKLTTNLSQKMDPTIGANLHFRKNFKPDALEYGISVYSYSVTEDRGNSTSFYDIQNYVLSLGYLHEMNQHFSSQKDPLIDLKIYAGPMLTYGWHFNDSEIYDKLGIGASVVVSIPLGKRLNFDLRSNISSYSSDIGINLRWLYQKKLPWRR